MSRPSRFERLKDSVGREVETGGVLGAEPDSRSQKAKGTTRTSASATARTSPLSLVGDAFRKIFVSARLWRTSRSTTLSGIPK